MKMDCSKLSGDFSQIDDPLSSFLFNSVLQSAMEKDAGIWNEKGVWSSN